MIPKQVPYDIERVASSPSQALGPVLIVEDELLIGLSLQEYLREEGFEVHYYGAGKDAIVASETLPLQAAVVDLVLKDCSGADVVRRIRARHPHVPIVLMTAADPLNLWNLAEEVGLHVLLKPFMEQRLLQILRELTCGREQA